MKLKRDYCCALFFSIRQAKFDVVFDPFFRGDKCRNNLIETFKILVLVSNRNASKMHTFMKLPQLCGATRAVDRGRPAVGRTLPGAKLGRQRGLGQRAQQ